MRKRIFLLYVVMDMSESMSWNDENGQAKIRTAMNIVPSIVESTKRNSTVAAALRVSVIGFNQSVSELFETDKTIKDRHVYALDAWWKANKENLVAKCNGQTYFSKLFEELNVIIKRDQRAFDSKEYELYRPVVYLLTDGKPEGKSETKEAINTSLNTLVSDSGDMKAPAILSIGIGDKVARFNIEQYAAGRLIKKWKYDPEKKKDIPEYSNGEYKKSNKHMAFVFKGNNASRNLKSVNRAVVKSVINSIQQVESPVGSTGRQGLISTDEPDFTGGFEMLIDEDEKI